MQTLCPPLFNESCSQSSEIQLLIKIVTAPSLFTKIELKFSENPNIKKKSSGIFFYKFVKLFRKILNQFSENSKINGRPRKNDFGQNFTLFFTKLSVNFPMFSFSPHCKLLVNRFAHAAP